MTCPFTPSCHQTNWCAKSTAVADVEAFKADVVAFMKANDRQDVGKCAALVLKAALAVGECFA